MQEPKHSLALQRKYCPPIDDALFAAIASDYDLSQPDSEAELRACLETLKESAIEQENLPFDPSGTANNSGDFSEEWGINSDHGTSMHDRSTLRTATESTSISDDSQTRPSSGPPKSRAAYTVAADGSLKLSGASSDDKVASLSEMFPTLSTLRITHTLKKTDQDLDKAMDELLNHSFFGETQLDDESQILVPKGIEGFNTDWTNVGQKSGRKQKKQRQKQKQKAYSAPTSPADGPPINKWEAAKEDIDFICSRAIGLSVEKVKSAYHANGASVPLTIRALAFAAAPKDSREIDEDAVMLSQVAELAHEHLTIPKTALIGLLRITRSMISATNELAAVMVQQPESPAHEVIKFKAEPLNLEDEDENIPYSRGYSEGGSYSALGYEQARAAANEHFAAGSAAYRQAVEASRRARSHHLYAGAAAVYRERGQEHRELGMQRLATASDRLVDRQSSGCQLDLHGVTVLNAIRITRERVEAWWDGLGDTKYVRGGGKHAHDGFKIVTGVGNHSHDGTARLGPAVSKMLLKEGWSVEIERGFLIVTGKSRGAAQRR
ncbi:uncharacterized protein N7483_009535 [Penicillium malachiteum]|uniref:uncharacterized protein n=1 Tax=Penicillium malachiteum TaxID=1324776 RepID=UPI00254983DA|nr:uncharacterized protein N7483_009535 [Penicillium malachiteum]KAJ5721601.1 hypothetical protein N7483_009535 [Penicillium malachiteum]